MSKKTGTIIKFVSLGVAVVLLIVLLWLMLDKGKEPEQIAYSGDEVNSLTSLIENGDARAVYIINGSEAYVLVNGSETSYESFKADPTSNADYVAELPGYSVFFDYVHSLEDKGGFVMPEITTHYYSGVSWTSFIFPAIMLIIMCVVLYIIFRQSAGANKQESEHERARPFQRRRGRGRGKGRAQRDRRLPQKPSKIQRGRRAYPQGRAPCRSSRYR